MNKSNDLISQLPDIVSSLQSGKLVEFETHGFSMVPLLRDGGDRVILKKADKPLAVGDVALCKTDDNRYVLHRVLSVEDGYILKGDNCILTEHCSGDSDVIGVAVAFIRKGKTIETADKKYLFYVRHRAFFLKVWRLFWSIADRLVKIFR